MENLSGSHVDPKTIMDNMIDNASKIWESIASVSSAGVEIPGTNSKDEKIYQAWEPAYTIWKQFAEILNTKELLEELTKGGNDSSENFQKFYKSGMNGYSFFQKKWAESAKNIENIFNLYKNDGNGNYDIFKIYNNIYEKEFSRFFSIPSLGLSREYQQKIQQLLDKSNVFNGALTEFMYFMYLPFEKSFKVVQDMLVVMAEKGKLPEDQRDYYNIWIEQLEKHYMSLFKSSEYLEALGNVVGAMSDFKAAQQKIVQDCLKMFGIPVEQDMDELYKDIYLLKKRIRKLEKENKTKVS